jgi:Fe-S oxidoreductase
MNPHKLIDPYRADEHLRQGPAYRPIRFDTRFAFPKDGNGQFDNFSRAVERCVGMGKCRSQDGGTMCPSYRATGEEKYSTRGRARLFAEMLRGDVVKDGWNSEAVKEALDLCLACKGCKSDCPTHVDMASYKAEFLSHYYERQRRPVQAWSMGRIGQWTPLAAMFPRLVNLVTQKEPLASIARAIGGIARGRSLPLLARRTFRSTFVARPAGARRVILWVDTFSNHFQPEVAEAALRVLEHAGCTVVLPKKRLCCGRPLYDFGLLDQARLQLAEILDVLGPEIDAGTPVVGLEPSCTSVFRDELLNLFPDDARARNLAAQTLMFADYLQQIGYQPAVAGGAALVQGHCHQKAVLGMTADAAMLAAAGVHCSSPESGCCGMAGSFGFHPDTADTAQLIGERALLPAVRASDSATRLVANGFSCREQIRLGSGRVAVHIAQVLDDAIQKEFRDN